MLSRYIQPNLEPNRRELKNRHDRTFVFPLMAPTMYTKQVSYLCIT